MFDGVVVSEPFLLYHDEISVGTSATSGNLTCIIEASSPVWRDVDSTDLTSSSSPYQSTPSGSWMRLSRTDNLIPNDTQHNWLWSCVRQDQGDIGYIGIYKRGGGKKVATHFSS